MTTNKIKVLDSNVINKIAAGEVVARPASVVKELVENSIDAGASEITIELLDGGVKQIVIRDNGIGIAVDQVELALTRHATSKISEAEDLFSIQSMGFRGEALASITAVSDFSLRTLAKNHKDGVFARNIDEKLVFEPWYGSEGTIIEINNLFQKIPARLKFLKSHASEYAYCLEQIQALALSHPQIHFNLIHNNKESLRLPAVIGSEIYSQDWYGESALKSRFMQIFSKEQTDKLIYHKYKDPLFKLEMLLSTPGIEKATTKHIFNFVNQRWVKDPVLRIAIMRGYHSHILKGRYPQILMFLTLDPGLVDVNVHPSKTEVRFQYTQDLQDTIAKQIRIAIRQGAWANVPEQIRFDQNLNIQSYPVSYSAPQVFRERTINSLGVNSFFDNNPKTNHNHTNFNFKNNNEPSISEDLDLLTSKCNLESTQSKIPWRDLKYIGNFSKCYLFFEYNQDLLVIDQHAFHERILYEQFSKDKSLVSQSQPLLVPEEVSLSPIQIEILISQQKKLEELGFSFTKLGDSNLEVTKIPALLANRSLDQIFAELAEIKVDVASEHESMHHILATLACHAAVRAGEDIDSKDIIQLINQADQVDFYLNCPHGRKVFYWWTNRQVSTWFDRT